MTTKPKPSLQDYTWDNLHMKMNSEATLVCLWLAGGEHEDLARAKAKDVAAMHEEIMRRINADED